jgi:hypothetical protein
MNNDYTQILIDVQKKSGITVECVKDIKILMDEIEAKTKSKMGYNTLRRLFGFLPETIPSKATLNTLSKYLELASYGQYINLKTNNDEWYFHQKLLNFQLNNVLNAEVIAYIEVGLTQKTNLIAIAYYINQYIQSNNIEALAYLFENLKFPKLSDGESMKFATLVSFGLLHIKKSKAILIYKKLLPFESFRNLVPLYFIDYSNLVHHYSEILQLLKQNSNHSSDIFFVDLMTFYKSFFQKENITLFQNIEIPNEFNTFHSVLKGRYLAYLIYSAKIIDAKLTRYILQEIKENQVSFLSLEVVAALIFKEAYQLLSLIFDKYYEDIFEAVSWNSKTHSAINLIGLAQVNWYNQNLSSAKKNLELVELFKVELAYFDYFSIFYYLTQLKISYTEKDLALNTIAKAQLEKHIAKTQFIVFQEQAVSYYL